MVWVFIVLALILLIVVSSKDRFIKKSINLRDVESTVEISTVNPALEEYLNSFNVYVVKLVYFIDGHEEIIREKIYDTDTNQIRFERAERFFLRCWCSFSITIDSYIQQRYVLVVVLFFST